MILVSSLKEFSSG